MTKKDVKDNQNSTHPDPQAAGQSRKDRNLCFIYKIIRIWFSAAPAEGAFSLRFSHPTIVRKYKL
jgi:hypothetical protein